MKAIDDYEIREKAKFVKLARTKDFGSNVTTGVSRIGNVFRSAHEVGE